MQNTFDFYRRLPVRPRRPERLFFCLLPDAVTAMRIGRFRDRFIDENHLNESTLEIWRLHVSLHHLGDYPRLRTKYVYAARKAGGAVSARPIEMPFRAIKSFGGRWSEGGPRNRPLVLLSEGENLSELHTALGAALNKNGLRSVGRVVPHMTLSYGRTPVPFQPIEPIRLETHEFALVHSKLGLGEYEVIERWPLRG